ncbi:Glyceraldehyde 3-phosphate dehydrogenase [Giardia duodenalis]|uniref:Glyceraldehyde-3-phosphate dehydrogenase n=2 Tax=Giardia intestinalis TaxID=5741 RepID=E2RU88_GIAIC|nr:Glyceraldehyde 3-phosphate dehydrogenase [Giardia intestinalis]AAB18622.1 putative glyceraldehyde 3-phosphate dehydrogenase [Giardia intestinalis]KAE8301449.1 Glyceraldehyde 3-phosphate dehydrogenase [Giardia intestinalis]|eukprot:XP_001704035.1 Glyceraldehyde 3-phosphate dehydrogenase [Giardia lamblia ATCC 50803]
MSAPKLDFYHRKVRIGISGFGRIGRFALRYALTCPNVEIAAINNRNMERAYFHYLFTHDSVHGPPHGFTCSLSCPCGETDCNCSGNNSADHNLIWFNDKPVYLFTAGVASEIPWEVAKVDVVLECTGAYLTVESCMQHMSRPNTTVKKVVISAPSKEKTCPTFVYGVNHKKINAGNHTKYSVISNASCTTNCLAPLAKVIHENFGIKQALMSTIHAVTATQPVTDSVMKKRDWRSGRACLSNIIPASTGAASALTLVIPELAGRITGTSWRVPVQDVSVVDLVVETEKDTSYAEICAAVKRACETPDELCGIMAYRDDFCVSSDFLTTTTISNFDSKSGIELHSRFFKLVSWYDNECGYSAKLVDMAAYLGSFVVMDEWAAIEKTKGRGRTSSVLGRDVEDVVGSSK